MTALKIQGRVLHDKKTIEKYSHDSSSYSMKPALVIIPKGEEDIIATVRYARQKHLPITGRAAASNVCGSALGRGIVIDFSSMKSLISRRGRSVRIQPGMIYDELNRRMKPLFLPYTPSSGSFCSIGGNVSTKASGLRGVKYGGVDNFVRSIRFVDTTGRIVDTAVSLPPDLEKSVMALRKKLLGDKAVMKVLKKKDPLKTSSGYNLSAFYQYKRPEEIVTHLMVGSVGTLGLFTEIELELVPLPKKTITCLAFFKTIEEAGATALKLLPLGPSALEIMDAFALDRIRTSHHLPKSQAALLIEFDSPTKRTRLEKLLEKYAMEYLIETSQRKQEKLWDVRTSMLERIEEEKGKAISFIEDVGVPVQHLVAFIQDVQAILRKNRIEAVIYGHAGEGNLHIRPLIPEHHWKQTVQKLADDVFAAVFRYGGTITGEHGIGRNKAPYLKREWGPRIYGYFHEVKNLFDPTDLFNPGIMFSRGKITDNVKY